MAEPETEESKGLVAQLARSGRMRIAAALVVVALVGGGLGVIMLQGESGGQKLLFSGLDLEEAAEITNKLDTAGVPTRSKAAVRPCSSPPTRSKTPG
jgi:flagellar biosynthesis/type III secretory pathway M-ring protein FliF/YscJ